MNEFRYYRPRSLPEALHIARERPGTMFLAGGTDALVSLKAGIIQPPAVVDISALPELTGITVEHGEIVVGALTTHAELAGSPIIRAELSALAEAAGSVGSPQIRNTGTIGGNIANASPAADTVTALVALGASVQIGNEDQVRQTPVEDLFLGPKKTALQDGDLILSIRFKSRQYGQASAFHKVGRRKALAISVVNAAVWLELDPGLDRVVKCRIALGSVAPTVIRVSEAEKAVEGQVIIPALIDNLGDLVSLSIKPIDDIRSTAQYRQAVAGELVKRAFIDAWTKAKDTKVSGTILSGTLVSGGD